MNATPLVRIPIGVVVERRKAKSSWIDYVWRPVTVLSKVPDTEPWTLLKQKEEWATFYAGAAEVALYPSETTQYRDNLISGSPSLWIVLRPTGTEPPFDLVLVTADTAEGEGMTQTGTDLVEPVPMPDSVYDAIAAFVAVHHVERVFFKRKRDRSDPNSMGRRDPARGNDK